MLLQNLKNFFVKNKLLSSAFVVLLAVCFFGALFGLNQLVREKSLYNSYMTDKKTYTVQVSDSASVDAALSAYVSKYESKTGIIKAEINNTDNLHEKLTAIYIYYDNMDYYAYQGNSLLSTDINSKTSNKVILLNENYNAFSIGTKYMVNGEEYDVVGLCHDGNTIAYSSLTDKTHIKSIEIMLTNVLSQAEHDEFVIELRELFYGCRIDLPDVSGVLSIWNFSTSLYPILILLLLGINNLSFLYAFFLKMRRKHITIMRICGATRKRVILLFLAEILLLIFGMFVLSALTFKFLNPLVYKNSAWLFVDSLQFSHYMIVLLTITIMSVIIFLPTIAKHSKINLTECTEDRI